MRVFLAGQNELKGGRKLETRFGHAAIRKKKMRQRPGVPPCSTKRTKLNDRQEEKESILVRTQGEGLFGTSCWRGPWTVDVEAEDMDLDCLSLLAD